VSLETRGAPTGWKQQWHCTAEQVDYSIEQALRRRASTINMLAIELRNVAAHAVIPTPASAFSKIHVITYTGELVLIRHTARARRGKSLAVEREAR
jgi:hypothetical protein